MENTLGTRHTHYNYKRFIPDGHFHTATVGGAGEGPLLCFVPDISIKQQFGVSYVIVLVGGYVGQIRLERLPVK